MYQSSPVNLNVGALHRTAFQQTMRPMRMRVQGRKRQQNPFSARPQLRVIPERLQAMRLTQLQAIKDQCATNELGCWMFPIVRDEAFPYIDIKGDAGEKQQWSTRRFTWALKNGDIPERGIILGGCPFVCCVNPDHQALCVPPLQMDWIGR